MIYHILTYRFIMRFALNSWSSLIWCHDITQISMKVVLNTINLKPHLSETTSNVAILLHVSNRATSNKMNCELMLTYDTPALRQTGSRNLMDPKMLPTIWGTYMKLVTKYQISAINSCWEKCDGKCAYMFNVYKNQLSWQTGSRNLMGPKMLPTLWGTYMKLVTKYQISAINSCWEKCDEKCAYMFNVYKNQQVGKQEVGIWWVQRRYPQYGIPIWCLWPNIRFLPSTVTEKSATKNILDGRKDGQTDRGKTVYPLPLRGAGV